MKRKTEFGDDHLDDNEIKEKIGKYRYEKNKGNEKNGKLSNQRRKVFM